MQWDLTLGEQILNVSQPWVQYGHVVQVQVPPMNCSPPGNVPTVSVEGKMLYQQSGIPVNFQRTRIGSNDVELVSTIIFESKV